MLQRTIAGIGLGAALTVAATMGVAAQGSGGIVYTGYGGLDGIDYDCWDLATQSSAQVYFESDGGSIYNDADNLDPNGDGYACASGDFEY